MPVVRLGADVHDMATQSPTSISSATASARMLSALLRESANSHRGLSDDSRLRVADAISALILAVVTDRSSASVDTKTLTLFNRMARWLEEHLASSEDRLDSDTLGQVFHISSRRVRAIFAAHATSVSTFVKQRRLEIIRQDILNPQYSEQTIREIGHRHGFTDAASLSRAFSTQFGMSPKAYRKTHTGLTAL